MRRVIVLAVFGLIVVSAGEVNAQPAIGGPIRISEFLSDPAETGSDGAYEWVELQNVSSEAVTLSGWKIGDSKLNDAIPIVTIAGGGFLVVAGKSAVLPAEVAVVQVADGAIGGGLNNAGDTIRLLDATGVEVDIVVYGQGAELLAPPAGQALARTDDGTWRLAIRPTPGAPNAIASDADVGQLFPVPVEYRSGESRIHPAAWIMLAGAAGAGIAGLLTITHRTIRKKSHRAG